MKFAAIVVSVSLVCEALVGTGFAQTTTPEPMAPAQSTTTPAEPMTAPVEPTAAAPGKSHRAICWTEVKAKHAARSERRSLMAACMAPARKECAKQAVQQNLPKGDARKAFMKKCLSS